MEAWQQLPRRVYLETSTLQTIHDFGESIFESGPLSLSTHAKRVPGLADEISASAAIIESNVRGAFQYVVTAAALADVSERDISSFTRWVYEVGDIWVALSAAETFLPSWVASCKIGGSA